MLSRVRSESGAERFLPLPWERDAVAAAEEAEGAGRSVRRGERLERQSLRERERREAEEGAGEEGRCVVRRVSVLRRVRWRVVRGEEGR